MITPVVVVSDEGGDGCLEVRRRLIGDLINAPLDGLVIALQLAVGLRVVRRGQQEDFIPEEVVIALSEERICLAILVPSMIQACLVAVPDIAERSYPDLRTMLYAASPIAE